MRRLEDFPDADLRVFDRPPLPDPGDVRDVYLIGICGKGMGALAELLADAGYRVRGSDQAAFPPMSTRLEAAGIPVLEGYDPAHLDPAPDWVVVGNAALPTHPEATPLGEIARDGTPFSRLPIYSGDRDHVTGYVLRDEALSAAAHGRADAPASSVAREILTVPDSLALPTLFERLLDRREHLALVVGEYGGTAGVVSVEDVVETLLGLEIVDEVDHEHDMQAAARERWAERATRLGLVEPGDPDDTLGEVEQAVRDQKAAARTGITGGGPPTVT